MSETVGHVKTTTVERTSQFQYLQIAPSLMLLVSESNLIYIMGRCQHIYFNILLCIGRHVSVCAYANFHTNV